MKLKIKNIIYLYIVVYIFAVDVNYAQPASQYNNVIRGLINYEGLTPKDYAKFVIGYELNYVLDTTELDNKKKDYKILKVGNNREIFYSYYQFQIDSSYYAQYFGNSSTISRFRKPKDVLNESYEMYVDYAKSERTVIEFITQVSSYTYVEPLEYINWEYHPDTAIILSYLCNKATCEFRGRKWTAWFSSDIPINSGPWKLRGLPGLILKAYDKDKYYVFECVGLKQAEDKEFPMHGILEFPYSINCEREEYLKQQKSFYDNYFSSLSSMGFSVNVFDNNKVIETIPPSNDVFEKQKVIRNYRINKKYKYNKVPYPRIELE